MHHRPTNSEAGSSTGRLACLDGVRGAAALFVVAHHIWRSYVTVALGGMVGFGANWLLYGHLSVDVFIVLSGFCLMLPVSRAGRLPGGWRGFYKGRVRRILPPLYAALLCSMAVTAYHHYFFTGTQIAANALLLQDIWQGQNAMDPPLWSVAVEWKIYVLFPLLVWIWKRHGAGVLLLTAAIVSAVADCAILAMPCVHDMGLVCPWYVLLFAMGMVAADVAVLPEDQCPKRLLPALLGLSLAALAFALWMWPVTSAGEAALYVPHFPLIDTCAGFATALALLLMCRGAMRNARTIPLAIFGWRPLVFIGTMGYSLYLVHLLLIYPLKAMVIASLPFHPPWLVLPLVMAGTVAGSYLFHLLAERPFLSRRPIKAEPRPEIAALVFPAS